MSELETGMCLSLQQGAPEQVQGRRNADFKGGGFDFESLADSRWDNLTSVAWRSKTKQNKRLDNSGN